VYFVVALANGTLSANTDAALITKMPATKMSRRMATVLVMMMTSHWLL